MVVLLKQPETLLTGQVRSTKSRANTLLQAESSSAAPENRERFLHRQRFLFGLKDGSGTLKAVAVWTVRIPGKFGLFAVD